MTTSNKLARSRVKTPSFRLKWNEFVFHKLFINIKESSESWRDSFLDHVWGLEVGGGSWVRCSIHDVWTCLSVASVKMLTNATCGTMNIHHETASTLRWSIQLQFIWGLLDIVYVAVWHSFPCFSRVTSFSWCHMFHACFSVTCVSRVVNDGNELCALLANKVQLQLAFNRH